MAAKRGNKNAELLTRQSTKMFWHIPKKHGRQTLTVDKEKKYSRFKELESKYPRLKRRGF